METVETLTGKSVVARVEDRQFLVDDACVDAIQLWLQEND
jgi:hypothetical protein